ncbi:hypothetical protein ACEPAH_7757 [Sanghuangporus vaninii]
MFRSAATKIAHNSTLPALAGNKDLRPLQEMITQEKAVLQSFQRLSHDLAKANDCLRHWGAGEGDDLLDVLSASSTLLGNLPSALSQMAHHEASIREHMKAVRSMEENLDELRRRRKAVSAKADTAEKKLTKMNPEHKNLQQQTELLNNLREQIRNLDWEILSEEARLGDFKRTATKNWMTLKFGGLLEFAEKATIVAEMGKLVIEEIPLETTPPGQSRKFYTAYEKTEKTLTEARRCISEVVFDPQLVPSPSPSNALAPSGRRSSSIDGLPNTGNTSPTAHTQGFGMRTSSGAVPTPTTDEFGNLADRRTSHGQGTMPIAMPGGPIHIGDDGSRISSTLGNGGTSNFSSTMSPPGSPPASRFGGPPGSQFSTFPVRKASLPGPSYGSPPAPADQGLSLQPLNEGPTSSFAAEVENALANASSPIQGKTSLDGPAPSYETHDWTPSFSSTGLPRGAAPPTVESNPWDSTRAPPGPPPAVHVEQPSSTVRPPQSPPSHHARESEVTEDDEEIQLPYASPTPIEHQLSPVPDDHSSRRVHFGGHQEPDGNNLTPENAPATQERIPSPPLNDEEAHKAAAREVAREMDMLAFNPPPGPPPVNVDNRAPSPLQPPVPPYAQRGKSPPHDFGSTLAPEGTFRGSQTDLRSPAPASDVEVSDPQTPGNASSNHQPRPSMSINVQAPSPSYSYGSTNNSTYGTPPEMPAVQPLRTGSPASLGMATPGARTISAAAFKRPGIRTPSGSQSPSDSRPLPDVTPLALRKKKSAGGTSLSSSPYPGSSPNIQQEGTQQDSGADHSTHGSAPPDYESSYDVISSYSDPAAHATQEPRPAGDGYGQGKFSTNLDGEGLR